MSNTSTLAMLHEIAAADPRPLILYHAHCWDGFCAAWLLHRLYPEAEYVPVQYGQDPPDVSGRDVWIVDFSYPRATLLAMQAEAEHLLVLDHHKTAEEELQGLDWCVFARDKSGARLTWEFLRSHGGLDEMQPPWLVDYTEDRDLWRWKLPLSREISAGLHSYPLDFDLWDKFAAEPDWWQDRLAADGAAIVRAERNIVTQHVGHARPACIAGYAVPAVNATVLFSDIAGELAQAAPFGVAWFVRDDGKVQFSLRSRNGGLDVSAIARQFGGGGHAAAAGFELPMDEALRVLYPIGEESRP
jgi:uncharacterized protein